MLLACCTTYGCYVCVSACMAQTSHSFAAEYTLPCPLLAFFALIHVHILMICMLGSAVEEHELQLLQATFKDLASRSGTDRGTKGITADVLSRYLPLPGLLGGVCFTTRATPPPIAVTLLPLVEPRSEPILCLARHIIACLDTHYLYRTIISCV